MTRRRGGGGRGGGSDCLLLATSVGVDSCCCCCCCCSEDGVGVVVDAVSSCSFGGVWTAPSSGTVFLVKEKDEDLESPAPVAPGVDAVLPSVPSSSCILDDVLVILALGRGLGGGGGLGPVPAPAPTVAVAPPLAVPGDRVLAPFELLTDLLYWLVRRDNGGVGGLLCPCGCIGLVGSSDIDGIERLSWGGSSIEDNIDGERDSDGEDV